MTEVTAPSAWKKQTKAGAPMTLPSGNVMKLRRGSIQTFMKAGIVPNSLMAIVQSALAKGQRPESALEQTDLDNVEDMLAMVDNVLTFCAMEPKVEAAPKNEEDRDEGLLYVDEVDDEDKMFVFQWATGGTADVEQFRKEAGSSLDAVRAGKGLEDETE